jgi:hypothetical protein
MIRHEWLPDTGEAWDLSDTRGPVWMTDKGVEGLDFMEVESFTRTSPALAGQWLTGVRPAAREAFWPVVIGRDDWFSDQRAFWSTLRPGVYGTWRVTAPDATFRELRVRHTPQPSAYNFDPSVDGIEVRGVTLVADDPWWRGPAVSQTFGPPAASSSFYSTGAEVLTIGSGFTVANASITNPGDVPAWPRWEIIGPVTAFSVGVGTTIVSATLTLDAGETVIIDTDPAAQFATGPDGLIPFSTFTEVGFAEVPSGVSVPLAVTVEGSGTIAVSLSPRFYRAW